MKDFQNVFQNGSNSYNFDSKSHSGDNKERSFETLKEPTSKVQKDYNYSIQKIEDLQNFNNTLQKQLNDYALMFTEEKNEKKEVISKYDALQDKYHQQIESFSKEKIGMTKSYYILW